MKLGSWSVRSVFLAFFVSSFVGLPMAHAARINRREVAVPGSILGLVSGDLDGDGGTDLVVSYKRGSGPKAEKLIAVFFRHEDGWPKSPDVVMAAPRTAGVFDLGDAVGDARDELVYLAPDGAYAQGFDGRKPAQAARFVTTPSLVVSPEEDDLGTWDFLRTIGSFKEPVLIVPSRGDIKIYRRDEAAWKPWSRVDVDQYSAYDAEGETFRRDRRGGSTGRPYSFRATTIIPLLDFVEQTGDGRVDLVTSFEDRLAIFPAGDDGTFAHQPVRRMWFSVRTPAELESRDAGVSSVVQDLDGDGIADLCIQKIAGGITSLVTETYLFRGVRGGGFEERPVQSFRDEGFAALVRFIDVDGDGKLEMIQPESEVSIMRMSQVMISKELSLGLRIRRGAEKPLFFERQPVQKLETTFGVDLSVGATIRGTFPIFGHDFDGDGVRDAILSQGGDKMVLHRGLRKADAPFEDEGHVTLAAPGSSNTLVVPPDRSATRPPDVVVYYVDRAELAGKLFVFSAERESR